MHTVDLWSLSYAIVDLAVGGVSLHPYDIKYRMGEKMKDGNQVLWE